MNATHATVDNNNSSNVIPATTTITVRNVELRTEVPSGGIPNNSWESRPDAPFISEWLSQHRLTLDEAVHNWLMSQFPLDKETKMWLTYDDQSRILFCIKNAKKYAMAFPQNR